MSRKAKPLVQVNISYYRYPTSISRGWASYPVKTGLSAYEQEDRRQWLAKVADHSRSDFHKMVSKTFADPSDDELLHLLLARHGIFAQRFFHRSTRERVTRHFAEFHVDLQEFETLLSLAWGFKFRIYNRSDAIYRVSEWLYEQALFHAINDHQIYHQLEMWVKEFGKLRDCALCGHKFRVIDLPDWIYFGSNGCKICCFQCPIVESPKKRELTKLIPAFVESCGFIPTSDANPINYAFTCRLSTDQKRDVFLAFARMGGIDHVKKKFGSWFKALAETGALPDGVLATARGIRCLAQDGHVCHSLDEQRIDDWLSAHRLRHEREPCYPAHPTLNPTGRRRADWKVQGTFIEYFGLIGDSDYDKKVDEKILLAQLFKVDLVAIYPSDLEYLDRRLGCLLKA